MAGEGVVTAKAGGLEMGGLVVRELVEAGGKSASNIAGEKNSSLLETL